MRMAKAILYNALIIIISISPHIKPHKICRNFYQGLAGVYLVSYLPLLPSSIPLILLLCRQPSDCGLNLIIIDELGPTKTINIDPGPLPMCDSCSSVMYSVVQDVRSPKTSRLDHAVTCGEHLMEPKRFCDETFTWFKAICTYRPISGFPYYARVVYKNTVPSRSCTWHRRSFLASGRAFFQVLRPFKRLRMTVSEIKSWQSSYDIGWSVTQI